MLLSGTVLGPIPWKEIGTRGVVRKVAKPAGWAPALHGAACSVGEPWDRTHSQMYHEVGAGCEAAW